jgi:hypothetical protein
MKYAALAFTVMFFGGIASAQQATTIQMQCRTLEAAGNFVGPDETLVNGMVCRVVRQAAAQPAKPATPAAPAPPAAPMQDAGTTAPVVSPSSSAAPAPAAVPTPAAVPAPTQKGTVTFATILEDGTMQPLMPDWAIKWVKKNHKKYPGVHFQTSGNTLPGGKNFLVVFSASSRVLQGFQPVTHTNTATSMTQVSGTTEVSGSGTVTSDNGSMWNYDMNGTAMSTGTATTTTTTTTHENAAYSQNTNILYVTAYDEKGTMVAQQTHVYSTQSGGNAAYAAGYNIGNAFRAINARGRTLKWVIDRIEGKKQ